jgi:hypothetical protein
VKWAAGLLALVLITGLAVGLLKVEKTCRTVQADDRDNWFAPDQRSERTTCEWKVVSRL